MADEPWLKYQQSEGPWSKYAVQAPQNTQSDGYSEKVQAAGEEFDRTAKRQGSVATTLGNTAAGAIEAALAMGSGALGDVAGAATSIATQDPKKGESVRNALTYEPETPSGKAATKYVGALTEPVAKAVEAIPNYATEHGHPIIGQTLRAGIDLIGGKKALETRSVKSAARLAEETAELAPQNAKITQARSLGLKIPPSEGGGPVGKVLEGVAGKTSTEMEFSRANAKVINAKAGEEIGLKDKPLTETNLENAKKPHFAVYDEVKKQGRIGSDETFKKELEGAKERTAQANADYPEDTNELIDKEIKKFDKPSADASSMVEKIKSLRQRASRNMQSPDAEKFELGIAQKKIATAMENLIERQVKDKSLVQRFRNSRTQLAKIYNVEDAVSPNGNVSAAVLARQLKSNVPLSGNLRAIAESYQQFPKVMRYVDNLGGHAPFSALDYLVGGVEALAHPHAAARVIGALAARPAARGIIKSEAYQKRGIKPRKPEQERPHTLRQLGAGAAVTAPTVSDAQ